ncbi:hypothetical protein [Shimia biformata]|uniref:hypothetical protein n=1 Tax=Shimia biformata TaxID=1294299 RepID=UPI0019513179|nr:hypothetical protein [Shimia biformata]
MSKRQGVVGVDGKPAREYGKDFLPSDQDVSPETMDAIRELIEQDRKNPPKPPEHRRVLADELDEQQRPRRKKWRSFSLMGWLERFRKAPEPVRVRYYDTPSYAPAGQGTWHQYHGMDLSHLAPRRQKSRKTRYGALTILVLWVVYYLYFIY